VSVLEVEPSPNEFSENARSGWSSVSDQHVSSRFWLLACILAAEWLLVTDLRHPWLNAQVAAESTIVFVAALLFFGRDKLKLLGGGVDPLPIKKSWVAAHFGTLALFCLSNFYLLCIFYPFDLVKVGTESHAVLCAWYISICLLPVTLGGAMFGLRRLIAMLGNLGQAWGLAALCCSLMAISHYLLVTAWDAPSSWFGRAMKTACFLGVKSLLGLFYSSVVADSGAHYVGTSVFAVQISGQCSGIDGLALMLSLTGGWLVYARRELRMGRAVLLVPVSLMLIWLLNIVRVTTLIVIGNAGYPAVAIGGFHSEAGWILFSCVALGFLLTVNSVSWFRIAGLAEAIGASAPQVSRNPFAETNEAALYLMPFLAIIAAGLISVALSDGFEWAYGLRLLAALGVFYVYRRQYRRMDWRFGWLGPVAGIAVFAFWVPLDHWMGKSPGMSEIPLTSLADGLARLSSGQRFVWIAVRTITAVVTVPVAEELAFRGYLARRLMSEDVETVPFNRLSLIAVLGSSVAFGALHGRMWLAGMLAGVVFALVARLRGRLGEAVTAHATANLMIAIWVLARGDYSLW
jgi:exosortase E/protease (VPEID-CTERM system)